MPAILHDKSTGRKYNLTELLKQNQDLVIGRSKESDIVIGLREDGKSLLKDSLKRLMTVSRKHLRITYDAANDAYFIKDENSSNGTYYKNKLTGEKGKVPAMQQMRLDEGTILTLGNYGIIEFKLGK